MLPENTIEKNPLLVILGPTASGKTHLAARIADKLGGEIISADSRQVYRGMTIGTGKDLHEFQIDGRLIPYHLIDILDAGERYNVHRFQQDFGITYEDITRRKRIPIACGGSGHYIEAVLKGYAFTEIPVDEGLRAGLGQMSEEALVEMYNTFNTIFQELADTSTRKRLIRAIEISSFLVSNPESAKLLTDRHKTYSAICFGLNPPTEVRRDRISARLEYRLANGLIDEVRDLMDSGLSAEQLMYYGLEYKYITQYLTEVLSLQEMKARLETEIHRFAKRQMTFFRKMEKDGIIIHWLSPDLSPEMQMDTVVSAYESFKTGTVN